MKFGQLIVGILLGGMLGFGLKSYFNKPKIPEISALLPKWNWPDSLDAVKAAPENHYVVYEDSTVRILQVLLNANMEEPVHTHKWKSVMWIAKPAVPCKIYQYKQAENGKFLTTDSITISHMDTNIGQPVDPEGPTGIKNLGNDSGIAYRVEFKKDFMP